MFKKILLYFLLYTGIYPVLAQSDSTATIYFYRLNRLREQKYFFELRDDVTSIGMSIAGSPILYSAFPDKKTFRAIGSRKESVITLDTKPGFVYFIRTSISSSGEPTLQIVDQGTAKKELIQSGSSVDTFLFGKTHKVIQLSNVASGKTILLKTGDRIRYRGKDDKKHIAATLSGVTDSSMVVGEKQILFSQLVTLGKPNKPILSVLLIAFGASFVISAIQQASYDPCPSCQDEGSSGQEWTVVEIGLGVGLFVGGIYSAAHSAPRIGKQWSIKVINRIDP